jgi:integrase
MAINLHCYKCKSSTSLKSKSCKKCGQLFSKGKKRYRVVVKTTKGKRSSVIVPSISKARKIENKLKTQAMEQKLFGMSRVPSVEEIWKKYLSWAKENKKSWDRDELIWNCHIRENLNGRKMDKLTPYDIQNVTTAMKLKRDYAPATIKHTIVLIKRIYNWSIEMGLYDGKNPVSMINIPKVNNEITECLTRNEIKRLFNTLDGWVNQRFALLTKFALYTGFRRGEIFALKWEDVELDNALVYLKETKGGKNEILPVSEEALKILKKAKTLMPVANCPYVFPNRYGQKRTSLGNTWTKIKKHAKISHRFRFHGLRHTFASYLASSNRVSQYTLQKLLTHKSPKMTQRYAHLFDDTLRKGVNVLTDLF